MGRITEQSDSRSVLPDVRTGQTVDGPAHERPLTLTQHTEHTEHILVPAREHRQEMNTNGLGVRQIDTHPLSPVQSSPADT